MALGLWLFWTYSFLGYLLEKGYAAATASPRQTRKCFLLLPLCPVYGLAMLAVLHLPADLTRGFFRLAFYGGLTATAVEYAVHFLYDKLLGVMFWDYSGTHMDLNRRVCVPFAVVWGPLTAFALRQVQPLLHPIALHAPAGAGLAMSAGLFALTRNVNRVPVVGGVNRVLGGVLGAAEAFLLCYLIGMAAAVLITFSENEWSWLNTAVVQKSTILNWFVQFEFPV